MTPVFSQSFFLSAGETDAQQEMSLPVLTAKLIDIATAHANSLGIGNPSMESLHCGWVLSRLTIEMDKYPHVNDTYSISTWVESWNRHFSMRCFRVDDASGNPVGYARSVWMVLDTVTRENAGLSHLSLDDELIAGIEAPIARQAKHLEIYPEFTPPQNIKRGGILATAPIETHTFKYCDLDAYRHVNTVRYVALLLNQFTLEEFDATRVKRLELSFLHEANYGKSVDILRNDNYESSDCLSSFYLRDSSADTPILYSRILRQNR